MYLALNLHHVPLTTTMMRMASRWRTWILRRLHPRGTSEGVAANGVPQAWSPLGCRRSLSRQTTTMFWKSKGNGKKSRCILIHSIVVELTGLYSLTIYLTQDLVWTNSILYSWNFIKLPHRKKHMGRPILHLQTHTVADWLAAQCMFTCRGGIIFPVWVNTTFLRAALKGQIGHL